MNMSNNQAHPSASVIAALLEQLQILKEILGSLKQPQQHLGLINAVPGEMRIYCNRQHGGLWYTLENSEPRNLDAKAVRGYLKKLEFEKVTRRDKESCKLIAWLDCGDRMARLECGSETLFCKGILSAIAALSVETLKQPIAIAPQPGNDESVLFAQIFDHAGARIITSWDETTEWKAVAQQAIANVNELTPAERF